jgi:Xaa-Pro aminopeptidase
VRQLLLAVALGLPSALESQFPAREHAQRREMLTARFSDAVIVVLGAPEPAKDYLEFYQHPGLLYLTGIREPNAALVMVKQAGRLNATVFVRPRDPGTEVWSGTRMGLDGAVRQTGLPARDVEQLTPVLDSLGRANVPFFVIGELPAGDSLELTAHEQYVEALKQRHPQLKVTSANLLLDQLRGRKSPGELALIRRAVDITVTAHRQAMQTLHADMNEFEVEAVIEHVFRRNGAERPAFASIIGSGPNSTILHYNVNDRFMRPGEVVVMDIGASYKGYAADVTRTVPTSGTFSPEQRQIYQIVRDAQASAERQAKPGAMARAMTDSAAAIIAAGLARLGLIESADATVDFGFRGAMRQMPQYAMYFMHGLGHGIGLEVHDPEQFYFSGVIAEGSAFTIEPGIYVRSNLLDIIPDTPKNRAMIARIRSAVERYKNIGVRIEDDYIVTDKGLEWISRAPREIGEIEALMKTRAIPVGRDADLVRAYKDSVP